MRDAKKAISKKKKKENTPETGEPYRYGLLTGSIRRQVDLVVANVTISPFRHITEPATPVLVKYLEFCYGTLSDTVSWRRLECVISSF